jgi:hypothetical protein
MVLHLQSIKFINIEKAQSKQPILYNAGRFVEN